ncbi:MAG: YXWGXW repeat-containing protein [Candidatus Acidiferrales bacterium]
MIRKFAIRSILVTIFMFAMSAASFGQLVIRVGFAPPPLPVYEQPVCPGEGYLWTPGYWAWDADGDDYYWVPGTWVEAPEVGYLWTPGYWGWDSGFYVFHGGYWGPRIGFYGGINYGFGYFGRGYEGGRWDHEHFYYNREVNNVNVEHIHNVYNERINVRVETHVSYNGGHGGINERATREEEVADHERHISPVANQVRHQQLAREDRGMRASENHGKPPIAATPRAGDFKDRGVAPAREAGGTYNPPANRGGHTGAEAGRGMENNTARNSTAVHVKDLPPPQRHNPPNTGNQKYDQKYQQQQERLATKQDQERQRLQQRQDQEHQRLTQQRANEARTQQVEQRHQQQTQQLQQKHEQQQQHLQSKQQPPKEKHPK